MKIERDNFGWMYYVFFLFFSKVKVGSETVESYSGSATVQYSGNTTRLSIPPLGKSSLKPRSMVINSFSSNLQIESF